MVSDAVRVKAIFLAAVERYPADQWPAYLDGACGEDAELRERVERLLGAHGGQKSLHIPAPSQPGEAAERPAVERPGEMVGPYKLLEEIGEGGMGTVFLAEQARPVRREVALKVIKVGMDTRQVVARFEAERQALALMDHPNIARVLDAGATESGRPYFVMELVRGIPITEFCDRERLSIPERLGLFVLVCRAVQHAHQKGVIHRDLKPSNILVTVIDGAAVPKVIDFGVAKATGPALTERTLHTGFSEFVGTPLYMSPEQAELSGVDVDTRSDIYSLGVLLYELLTGTTPFDAGTFRRAALDEMRRIIREQEPPRPSTRLSSLGEARSAVSASRRSDARHLERDVRGELDWVVMKALEKDRRRRYETAGDFASDVARYLTDQPVQACPPSAGYRLRKFVRRNRGPVTVGLALATLLVLGTVGTSIGLVWALRAERWATLAADRARAAEGLATNRLLDATREKDRATAAEATAKDEAAAAEAVVSFLQDDLLAQADPVKNPRDRRVTVEEVLGRAAARIGDRFARQPSVEARIRWTIGRTYRALSDYSAARPHLERAWELCRDALGEDDLNALHVLDALAGLYQDQGRVKDAAPLFDKVLKLRLSKLGEESPDTLSAMTNLAENYRLQGRVSEAETLLHKVLDLYSRTGKQESALIGMNNLAVLYLGQRQYSKAEPLLVKVVDAGSRGSGKEDRGNLTAMNNLSEVYVGKGEYLKAAALLEKTVRISRRVRGENHDLTLQEMNNLARAYWFAGRLDRSIPLFEEAVQRYLAAFGPEFPGTINAIRNLGINYRDAGRLPEGIAKLGQAWELERKRNGPGGDLHGWLPITRELADAYDRAGRFSDSEPLYREALEAERRHHGRSSPEAAGALNDLGVNLLNQRKFEDAEPPLREALRAFRERDGEASPRAAGAMAWLGLDLLKQEKYADAEPLLRECLRIREQKAPDDWTTFNVKSLLGGSLWGQKKYAGAEPLLLAGYEGMKRREGKIPPPGKPRLVEAIERVVRLYDESGRKDKADEWRRMLPATRSAEADRAAAPPAPNELPDDVFAPR
jgi:serine/threonine protein kinase/tetratricopeptide (TPR) repeat protein